MNAARVSSATTRALTPSPIPPDRATLTLPEVEPARRQRSSGGGACVSPGFYAVGGCGACSPACWSRPHPRFSPGRHPRPAFPPHALVPVTVPPAPSAQTPEQNPGEQQQAHSLPILHRRTTKQTRDEPVPQTHHHQAQERDAGDRQHQERYPFHYPTSSTSHIVLLMSATNRPRPLAAAAAGAAPHNACARAAC